MNHLRFYSNWTSFCLINFFQNAIKKMGAAQPFVNTVNDFQRVIAVTDRRFSMVHEVGPTTTNFDAAVNHHSASEPIDRQPHTVGLQRP